MGVFDQKERSATINPWKGGFVNIQKNTHACAAENVYTVQKRFKIAEHVEYAAVDGSDRLSSTFTKPARRNSFRGL